MGAIQIAGRPSQERIQAWHQTTARIKTATTTLKTLHFRLTKRISKRRRSLSPALCNPGADPNPLHQLGVLPACPGACLYTVVLTHASASRSLGIGGDGTMDFRRLTNPTPPTTASPIHANTSFLNTIQSTVQVPQRQSLHMIIPLKMKRAIFAKNNKWLVGWPPSIHLYLCALQIY